MPSDEIATEISGIAKLESALAARRAALVAELARRGADPTQSVQARTRVSRKKARRIAQTAVGLTRLPKVAEALEDGQITEDHADTLAKNVLDPEVGSAVELAEESLLSLAKRNDAERFNREVREWAMHRRADDGRVQLARLRAARKASMWTDAHSGMHVLHAEFDPITGAQLSARLAAMTDALWRSDNRSERKAARRSPAQRRADALARLILDARRGSRGDRSEGTSSDGPLDSPTPTPSPHDTDPSRQTLTPDVDESAVAGHIDVLGSSRPERDATGADAEVAAPDAADSDDPDDGAVRVPATTMLVIADFDVLTGELAGGRLADGTPLPAETVARLGCDARLLPAFFDTAGQAVRLGRTVRLATSGQRAVVTARDRGCVGCGAPPEWCQVHHIRWWRQGGSTDVDNLCLLCSTCHHDVHEGGAKLLKESGRWVLSGRTRPPPKYRAA